MKTNKLQMIATVVVAAILSLAIFAQDKEIITINVNGLKVGGVKYTKSQIVSALGEPVRYESYEENYDFYEYYYYNKSRVAFENGELVEFLVEDPQFKCFDGRVKIGSSLSVVGNLPGCRFELMSHNVLNMVTYSELWVGYAETHVSIGHKNGVIVCVSYSVPN